MTVLQKKFLKLIGNYPSNPQLKEIFENQITPGGLGLALRSCCRAEKMTKHDHSDELKIFAGNPLLNSIITVNLIGNQLFN